MVTKAAESMEQLEAEMEQSPELQQHWHNIEDLDQSLAEFHSEADRDCVLWETQGSIVQMLKNQEEDWKHAWEMQESIRQLLENAAVDRQTAEERNPNLDVRLGDMTQTIMQTL
jgi:hypothetical protein